MSIDAERRVPLKNEHRVRSGLRVDSPVHFGRFFLRIGVKALLTMGFLLMGIVENDRRFSADRESTNFRDAQGE